MGEALDSTALGGMGSLHLHLLNRHLILGSRSARNEILSLLRFLLLVALF
jgi:hypothetical protein